ncbi:hypothetical protein GCM10012289_26200 [Nonomuraea cavernae]|uniref:Uncharacterized protein n=2 Tax=Nonomuraea cavernae TaxID=2045107 RepID=A0A917YVU4_9ACTN|nr:hypothetical protein GCM10012289_26200 [Nonomuraea cavernae]
MYNLRDYPDLYDAVVHWTAKKAMNFRFPADNESDRRVAGEYWRGVVDLIKLSHANNKRETLEEVLGSIRKANEGPAVEAFLDYWDSVPHRNAGRLALQVRMFADLLTDTGEAIKEYKRLALESLYALKQALDDANKHAWASLAARCH